MAQEGDCEWVVECCKACLSSNDRHGAKAWILTARSLFPDNFAVQYEAFSLHLCCEELKEAAKALADLCTKFPREPQLQTYISGLIAEVVRSHGVHYGSDTADKEEEDQVKKALFDLLPGETQKSILQQAADKSSDTLQRCRILLVALRLFPDTATTIGLDLYDILGQQPTGEYPMVADNPYRELLVNEVIPLLSGSREICIEHTITRTNGQSVVLKTSHLCQWLESSASYYTAITAQALLHNRVHRSAGRRGWEQLHQLFVLTAEKCGWRETLLAKQIGPHLPAKIRWLGLEKISGYNSHLQTFEAPRNVAIACFYISVFLFFEMAWEYCSEMLYPTGGGERSASSPRPSWVLIEERFTKSQADEKSAKRRKVDEHQAFMNIHTGSRSLDQRMVECFLAAIDCWDFLQSNSTYRGEFSRLCQQWGAFEWAWLSSFRADMAVYKGDHSLAVQILQHEWQRFKEEQRSKPESLRFILQMVNCSSLLGDVKSSCQFASEVISLIPDPGTRKQALPSPSQPPTPNPTAARQLRLLSCTMDEVLPYCITVIIRALKDVAFSDPKNERALGQLVVLLQYNWPKEEAMFASVITTIQKRRKFNFPEFFKYIITVDILEEMLFLANCESLQLTLLPQGTSGNGSSMLENDASSWPGNEARSRTVTRGVNRGHKEELVTAMERQLVRWEEPIEPLLRDFFKQETLSLPKT